MGTTLTKLLRERLGLENTIRRYLLPVGWSPVDIGILLMRFEDTYGAAATSAMGRYIEWAEENDEPKERISVTIAHDLNSCEETWVLPRSSSY